MAHKNKTTGIYSITAPSNKMYVGQSINVEKRLQQHQSMLRHGKHTNSRLQGACNKYGLHNLTFTLVEICEADQLDAREQWWIDNHNTQYNMSRNAINCMKDPEVAYKVLVANTKSGALKATSIRTKKMWQNSEYRAERLKDLSLNGQNPKTHDAIRKARNTPESKQKASTHANKLWANPLHREKMKVIMANVRGTEEYKKSVSEGTRNRHSKLRALRIEAEGLTDYSLAKLRELRATIRATGDLQSERYKVVIIALNSIHRSKP